MGQRALDEREARAVSPSSDTSGDNVASECYESAVQSLSSEIDKPSSNQVLRKTSKSIKNVSFNLFSSDSSSGSHSPSDLPNKDGSQTPKGAPLLKCGCIGVTHSDFAYDGIHPSFTICKYCKDHEFSIWWKRMRTKRILKEAYPGRFKDLELEDYESWDRVGVKLLQRLGPPKCECHLAGPTEDSSDSDSSDGIYVYDSDDMFVSFSPKPKPEVKPDIRSRRLKKQVPPPKCTSAAEPENGQRATKPHKKLSKEEVKNNLDDKEKIDKKYSDTEIYLLKQFDENSLNEKS